MHEKEKQKPSQNFNPHLGTPGVAECGEKKPAQEVRPSGTTCIVKVTRSWSLSELIDESISILIIQPDRSV